MNNDNDGALRAEKSRKAKKNIIIALVCMCLFVVLYFIVTNCVDFDKLFGDKSTYNPSKQTIIFADINYDENIFENQKYMNMDRLIRLSDPSTGVTVAINENGDDYSEYGEDVDFLGKFIDYIIKGDYESYNACFSEYYYQSNKKASEFTMQKLYNITLIKEGNEDVTEDGVTYTRYEYYIDYMISANNGTFRRDVESDAIRRQYVVLTDKSGELLIDSVVTNLTVK